MQQELGLDYIYQERFSFQQNLHVFREFSQMISPMSCSATEGDHHIDLANQLLYGFIFARYTMIFSLFLLIVQCSS
jgi:hypothetical protein